MNGECCCKKSLQLYRAKRYGKHAKRRIIYSNPPHLPSHQEHKKYLSFAPTVLLDNSNLRLPCKVLCNLGYSVPKLLPQESYQKGESRGF